jgi:hypothetical protein
MSVLVVILSNANIFLIYIKYINITRIFYYRKKHEKLSIGEIIKKGANRRLIYKLLIFEILISAIILFSNFLPQLQK